ncbi:hypothetical protein K1X76_11995, partial [bacterium]|nr:hypothetical protein [bacterium]
MTDADWENFLYNAQTDNPEFYFTYQDRDKPSYQEASDAWSKSSYEEGARDTGAGAREASTAEQTTSHPLLNPTTKTASLTSTQIDKQIERETSVPNPESRTPDPELDFPPQSFPDEFEEEPDALDLALNQTSPMVPDGEALIDHDVITEAPFVDGDREDIALNLKDVVDHYCDVIGFLIQPVFKSGGRLNLSYFSKNAFDTQGVEPWMGLYRFLRSQATLLDGSTGTDPYSHIIEKNARLLMLLSAHITGDASNITQSEWNYRHDLAQFEKEIIAVNPYRFIADNLRSGFQTVKRLVYRSVNEAWDNGYEITQALMRAGQGMISDNTVARMQSSLADTRMSATLEALTEIETYTKNIDAHRDDQTNEKTYEGESYNTAGSRYTVSDIRERRQNIAGGITTYSNLVEELYDLWLWAANDANWENFEFYGFSNQDLRFYILSSLDPLIYDAHLTVTATGLQNLSDKIQQFLNRPATNKGGHAFGVLKDVLKNMPSINKEPFTCFQDDADKIASGLEMGEVIDPSEKFEGVALVVPEGYDAANIMQSRATLAEALKKGKLELYKMYRDQGYLLRGIANILDIAGQGELRYLREAVQFMDDLIAQLAQAATP